MDHKAASGKKSNTMQRPGHIGRKRSQQKNDRTFVEGQLYLDLFSNLSCLTTGKSHIQRRDPFVLFQLPDSKGEGPNWLLNQLKRMVRQRAGSHLHALSQLHFVKNFLNFTNNGGGLAWGGLL